MVTGWKISYEHLPSRKESINKLLLKMDNGPIVFESTYIVDKRTKKHSFLYIPITYIYWYIIIHVIVFDMYLYGSHIYLDIIIRSWKKVE